MNSSCGWRKIKNQCCVFERADPHVEPEGEVWWAFPGHKLGVFRGKSALFHTTVCGFHHNRVFLTISLSLAAQMEV